MEVKSRMLVDEKIPVIVMLKDISSSRTISKENGISVLKEKSSSSQQNIEVLLNKEKNKNNADKIKQFWIVNAIAVNATPELIEQLSERDDVESIGFDSQVHMIEDYSAGVSEGQINNSTTEIRRINATRVWEIGIDGTGINVSVIDTGINANHPDISGRVIRWSDYVNNQSLPYDDQGHGTHVAGTVGGNGAGGITTGVAPNVSLFVAKVLDGYGNGDSSDVIKAIEWSVDNKADIISLSLGGGRDSFLTIAINNAISTGVTVIAAAGNCGPGGNPSHCDVLGNGSVFFPAGEKNVIAVGAVDSFDDIASFSSIGPILVDGEILTKPDVSAPGVFIDSLNKNGGYSLHWNGTSMATPHVSGTVALMLQNARIHNITLAPSQIKNILANTSLDLGLTGKDNTFGWGRIDAFNVTMFDTESPSVIASQTINQSWQAAKNGSIVTINVTIYDNYGVKNASVNVSAINNSISSINLSYLEGSWKGNVTVNAIDGIYLLNVTAYDLSNNFNNTTQTIVAIDNTPPNNISLTSISYQHGYAAKNRSSIVFNVSADDPLFNQVSSGIKNASLNASAINSTGLITLNNNSGFWMGNVTFDKSVVDGNYSINVSFSDNAGNINNSMHVNISIDNMPPLVNDLSVSHEFINLTDSINITANITSSDNISQVNRSELFARMTYPNGTFIDHNLSKGSGNLFYKNFTDTAQYGRYNVTIIANDTTGNTNSSMRTQFATTYMTNIVVNITAGNPETYFAPYSNTSLLLNVNNSSNGTINISRSKINLTSKFLNVTNPGIYIFVNISQNIKNNFSSMILRVNYTDADVVSYIESSLRLYRWNISSSDWEKLAGAGSPSYVNDAGVDTVNNFVWANLTNFSEFALTGDIYVAPTLQLSGGGGGGGGGGASGENYLNIEVNEKYDISIYRDIVTSYRFTNNNNPIMFVNITGNVSFGDVTTSVEVLRNTSTMAMTEPPGIIYRNANIWVGSSSFNSPRNIKYGSIRFRVMNSWIEENNIASVRMAKWNKSGWEYLETNEISKDDAFTYYNAFAQVFSNFAITGTKYGTGIQKITTEQEIRPVTPVKETVQTTTPVIGQTKRNPGFGSIQVLSGLLGIYIFMRGRK